MGSSEERRALLRSANIDRRRKKRHELLDAKRMFPEEEGDELPIGGETITTEQMRTLASSFQRGPPDHRLHQLKMLKRMMGMDSSFIDAFLSVNNAIEALVGQLTCNDALIQVAAAGCIANISAGGMAHCDLALKHAAVYLISFLDGQNSTLKDHCCWALGNMAANGADSQEMLLRRGVITPLVNIIMTSAYDVNLMQSALFALANLLKNDTICSSFCSADAAFITRLLRFSQGPMTAGVGSGIKLDICRLLFHLSTRGDKHETMLLAGVFTRLKEMLVDYASGSLEDYVVGVTPLIRCLGNLACQQHDGVTMAIQDGRLVTSVLQLLHTETVPFYLQKEILWMLNNLTATCSLVCSQCVEKNLHVFLVERLLSKPPDVQKESIICLNHLLSFSPDVVMAPVIIAGLIQKLSELFGRLEEPTMESLYLLDSVLRQSPEGVQPVCEETGIVPILDSLMQGDDEDVRRRAMEVRNAHWGTQLAD